MTAGKARRLERHLGVVQNTIIETSRRPYLVYLTYCITILMFLTSNMPFGILIELITLPVPCSYFSQTCRIVNLSQRSIDRLPSLLHQTTRQHSIADVEHCRHTWDSLDFTHMLDSVPTRWVSIPSRPSQRPQSNNPHHRHRPDLDLGPGIPCLDRTQLYATIDPASGLRTIFPMGVTSKSKCLHDLMRCNMICSLR